MMPSDAGNVHGSVITELILVPNGFCDVIVVSHVMVVSGLTRHRPVVFEVRYRLDRRSIGYISLITQARTFSNTFLLEFSPTSRSETRGYSLKVWLALSRKCGTFMDLLQ